MSLLDLDDDEQRTNMHDAFDPFASGQKQEFTGDLLTDPFAAADNPFEKSDPFGGLDDISAGDNSFWAHVDQGSTSQTAGTENNTSAFDAEQAFEDLMSDEPTPGTGGVNEIETRPFGTAAETDAKATFGSLAISSTGSLLPPEKIPGTTTEENTYVEKKQVNGVEYITTTKEVTKVVTLKGESSPEDEKPDEVKFGSFTISSTGALRPPTANKDSEEKKEEEKKEEKTEVQTVKVTKIESKPSQDQVKITTKVEKQPSSEKVTPIERQPSKEKVVNSSVSQVTKTVERQPSQGKVTVTRSPEPVVKVKVSASSQDQTSKVTVVRTTSRDQTTKTTTYKETKMEDPKTSETTFKYGGLEVSRTGALVPPKSAQKAPMTMDAVQTDGGQSSSPVKQSTKKKEMFQNVSVDICCQCNKRVYEMEKMGTDRGLYHKSCFKCQHCKRILSLANFASMEGQLYCKPHFIELFKTKGNYDEGFGREKTRPANASPSQAESEDEDSVTRVETNIATPPPPQPAVANSHENSNEETLEEILPSIRSLRSKFETEQPAVNKPVKFRKAEKKVEPKVQVEVKTEATNGHLEDLQGTDMPSVRSSEDTPQSELPPAGFSRNLVAKFRSMEQNVEVPVSPTRSLSKTKQTERPKTPTTPTKSPSKQLVQERDVSPAPQDDQDNSPPTVDENRHEDRELPQHGTTRSLLAKWRSIEGSMQAAEEPVQKYEEPVYNPAPRKFRWEVKEARPLSRPAGPEHDYVLEPSALRASSSVQSLDEQTESLTDGPGDESEMIPQSITRSMLDKFRSLEDISVMPPTPEVSERMQKEAIAASKPTIRKFSASSGDNDLQLTQDVVEEDDSEQE